MDNFQYELVLPVEISHKRAMLMSNNYKNIRHLKRHGFIGCTRRRLSDLGNDT